MIPEPKMTHRQWTFTYTRPQRMGWPNLVMTDGRTGTPIAPRTIRVMVTQREDEAPKITGITTSGHWARTQTEVTGFKVHYDSPAGLALVVYAPDWVMDLAADALARAEKEVS